MPAGPCTRCGATNYASSLGGPSICPTCDAGGAPSTPAPGVFSITTPPTLHAVGPIDRREFTRVAQSLVDEGAQSYVHIPGARIVTVVTDASGDWVGVGRNRSDADTAAILLAALEGEDRVDHHDAQPGAVSKRGGPIKCLSRHIAAPVSLPEEPEEKPTRKRDCSPELFPILDAIEGLFAIDDARLAELVEEVEADGGGAGGCVGPELAEILQTIRGEKGA